DDVIDRERNQKQRKTDHGYRRLLRKTGTFPDETAASPPGTVLAHSLAKFRQTPPNAAPYPLARSRFLLGLQNLPALVHAGLQVEVVRTAEFAGILVLGIGRLLQSVRRAAHATPRGRCL